MNTKDIFSPHRTAVKCSLGGGFSFVSTHQNFTIPVSYVNYGEQLTPYEFSLDNFPCNIKIFRQPKDLGKSWRKDSVYAETTSKTAFTKGGRYEKNIRWWIPASVEWLRLISLQLFQKADRRSGNHRPSTRFCFVPIQKYNRENPSRTNTGSGIKRYCKSFNLYYIPSSIYSGNSKSRDAKFLEKPSTQNANDNGVINVIIGLLSNISSKFRRGIRAYFLMAKMPGWVRLPTLPQSGLGGDYERS